jgi:adenosylmethionine-8-amino-7-oxononanoate aminotransferase
MMAGVFKTTARKGAKMAVHMAKKHGKKVMKEIGKRVVDASAAQISKLTGHSQVEVKKSIKSAAAAATGSKPKKKQQSGGGGGIRGLKKTKIVYS